MVVGDDEVDVRMMVFEIDGISNNSLLVYWLCQTVLYECCFWNVLVWYLRSTTYIITVYWSTGYVRQFYMSVVIGMCLCGI